MKKMFNLLLLMACMSFISFSLVVNAELKIGYSGIVTPRVLLNMPTSSSCCVFSNSSWNQSLTDDLYILLTQPFSGDVSGHYNDLLVVNTQGLDASNITSGTFTDSLIPATIARQSSVNNLVSVVDSLGNFSANNASLWAGINVRIKNGSSANLSSLVVVNNITSYGYLMGQPLLGMLGSGIIQSDNVNHLSEVNVSCSGLSCSYNHFIVRLVSGNGESFATYCDMPASSVSVTNNQHNVLYVNSSCNILSTSIENFFDNVMVTGNVWDFANMACYAGSCELVNGIGLEQRRMMKQRNMNFNDDHLKVVSGFTKSVNTFPNWTLATGEYIYLMDVVTTNQHFIGTANSIEVIAPNLTGWSMSDQSTMNYSTCQNGTHVVSCTLPNRYRRVFFFMVNYDNGLNNSGVHQLLPSDSINYNSEASCLDTTTNPLTYTLPDFYLRAAMPVWAYCTQASSAAWSSTGWIDLRTVKTVVGATGSGGGGSFVPYSGATGNVDLSGFNVTANTFKGAWNGSTNYYTKTEDDSVDNSRGNFSANNASIWTNATDQAAYLGSLNAAVSARLQNGSIASLVNLTVTDTLNAVRIFVQNITQKDSTTNGTFCIQDPITRACKITLYTTGNGTFDGNLSVNNMICLAGDCRSSWNTAANGSIWNRTGSNVILANTGDNVGVGTTSPAERLSVFTGAGGTNQTTFSLGLDATQYEQVFPSYSTANKAYFNAYYSNGIPGVTLFPRYLDIAIEGSPDGTNGGGIIRFLTNPVTLNAVPLERMRIDANGNVGIGTNAPSSKLEVQTGNVLINNGTGARDFQDLLIGGIGGWSAQENHSIRFIYNTAASPLTFMSIRSNFNGVDGRMIFGDMFGAGAIKTGATMTVKGDATGGSVIVGGLNPNEIVSNADGHTYTGSKFSVVNTAKALAAGQNHSDNMFYSTGTYFNGVGSNYVGSFEHYKMTRNGGVVDATNDFTGKRIETFDNGGTLAGIMGNWIGLDLYNYALTQDANITGYYGMRNMLKMGYGGTERLKANSAYVYSGTVSGAAAAKVDSLYGYYMSLSSSQTVTNRYGLYLTGISGATNNYAIYADSGQTYLNGNVGIGTIAPDYLLDVGGDAYAGSAIINANAAANQQVGFNIQSAGTSKWYMYRPASSNDLRFWDGSDRITFQSGGNVGIGDTSPSAPLELVSNAWNNGISVGEGDNSNVMKLGYDNTNNMGSIQSFNGGAASSLILQQFGGNVGIGITAPGAKLEVAGSIQRNESGQSGNVTVGDGLFLKTVATRSGSTNLVDNNAVYNIYNFTASNVMNTFFTQVNITSTEGTELCYFLIASSPTSSSMVAGTLRSLSNGINECYAYGNTGGAYITTFCKLACQAGCNLGVTYSVNLYCDASTGVGDMTMKDIIVRSN